MSDPTQERGGDFLRDWLERHPEAPDSLREQLQAMATRLGRVGGGSGIARRFVRQVGSRRGDCDARDGCAGPATHPFGELAATLLGRGRDAPRGDPYRSPAPA